MALTFFQLINIIALHNAFKVGSLYFSYRAVLNTIGKPLKNAIRHCYLLFHILTQDVQSENWRKNRFFCRPQLVIYITQQPGQIFKKKTKETQILPVSR